MKLKFVIRVFAFAALILPAFAEPVRLHASPVLGQALISMLPALRELNIDLKVYNEASSSASINALANDQTDVVVTVRALSGEDRAAAPDKLFKEYPIGLHAIAVIVSPDVWEAGVRALSKEQLRGIYQREITNWKELGGADQAIKFYTYERGRGVWEQFANWVYGDLRKAPLPNFEMVVNGEDARNTVSFNRGAIALAAPRWADTKGAFALAIRDEKGEPVALSHETLASRRYPIARMLYVIFSDKPTGSRRRFLDYVLSPAGQEILRKNDLTPLVDLANE